MSLSRAWTALWICFVFSLKERAYSAHVVIGVILIIKTMIFLCFSILADISVLLILAIIKIC